MSNGPPKKESAHGYRFCLQAGMPNLRNMKPVAPAKSDGKKRSDGKRKRSDKGEKGELKEKPDKSSVKAKKAKN